MNLVVGLVAGLAVGVAAGFLLRHMQASRRVGSAEARAATVVAEAEREAETLRREALVEAKGEVLRLRQDAERDQRGRQSELDRRTSRLEQREQHLDNRERDTERVAQELADHEKRLAEERASVATGQEQIRRELQRVAGMTAQEAKAALTKRIEEEAKRDAMALVRTIETNAREEAESRARRILTVAVQRVASDLTTESAVSVVSLPSDDMKGRIIGREGRNIRAFEAATGVNIIVDDTPEAVLVSCFDPVRREVGRLTLVRLVGDGRIHPARIEEMHDRARSEVEAEIRKAGEEAVLEVGITDMHPELIRVLGRLRYRTSYGQNVLKHLVETAHIASAIASELGLPQEQVRVAKRGALLHDIGKAVTHEVEGSHAIIGAELARRLKESADVAHIIESHHGEVEQRTIEAVLAQTADHVSGGRPGARRETLESYVKRLEKIEEIANSYDGVDRTFAMQAGREIRVMVRPEDLDDLACQVLARDIAKRIEGELQYPGQIKVMVVRETRATEYAK